MKKIIISIFMLSMLFTACNTDLDINRDPDSVSDVPLKSQMPAGILGVVAAEGSYYAIIGGFWSQYWTQSNSANQYKDIDGYIIGTGDYFAAWRNMYDALGDIRNVKRKALATGNWKYLLISTVMEVQASQVLTDFYGSVPYKEANNISILNPKYDSGEEIYDTMITDLNLALSKDLTTSVGEVPATDDLVFKGDLSKWTKLANTMKLKIYMRQINSSRSAIGIAGVQGLLSSGVAFLDVDAAITQFEDAANLSNPLFETDRRQLNIATNLRKSKTLSSFFDANGDSRSTKYYGPGVALNQGDFESQTPASPTVSVVIINATTPAYLMSKEESLFLQAEAKARFGSGDKALYDAAVTENFNKYKLVASSYIATGGVYEYPTSGTLEQKIEAIITQKWIAGFPGNGFEAFFDKNRTGYPKTSLVPQTDPGYIPGQIVYSVGGATEGKKFPKRLVYPQEETNTNTSTPALLKITEPVWWAKN
ncbi:SusD/RagB family nutrient-binding outer membrane lipoprotein [Flavobacterium soyangense]|uniref:SusD/RagB family nutrient-binding outer membrane lipoprotein n=1 Tax=Flavobacterium soyangense TaxID=2023265 RepID=A0A930UA22_9FLAO|nr:SusD/RagB family nutrient-binding outer membrane lipoprotein [Flavobacterium soyangense]MBF2709708.1 SusD/RagB family nutrient-binding outer membrane lipoprotein [Flavobacterium soyangense]